MGNLPPTMTMIVIGATQTVAVLVPVAHLVATLVVAVALAVAARMMAGSKTHLFSFLISIKSSL